jgi:hypothetical protein
LLVFVSHTQVCNPVGDEAKEKCAYTVTSAETTFLPEPATLVVDTFPVKGPFKYEFADTVKGDTKSVSLTIRNIGEVAATNATYSGGFPNATNDMSFNGGGAYPGTGGDFTDGGTLAPKDESGDSCTISIQFNPSVEGDKTGMITIMYDSTVGGMSMQIPLMIQFEGTAIEGAM